VELRYVFSHKYVAVSCPWSLPDHEDADTGRYSIDLDDDMLKNIAPQNIVLDRVTNFAAVKGLPFWIDKLCVEQDEDSEEKEIAVQSMDIVYENSKCTIGLLFVRLDEEYQVDILGNLLSGRLVKQTWSHGRQRYELRSTPWCTSQVIEVIEMILEDRWWNRAWIFQEEYLSTTRMRLLIRSSHWHDLDRNIFGNTPGELDFSAVEFRKASTQFCLALCQSGRDQQWKDRCLSISNRAGRYSMLLLDEGDPQSLQPMSPTILHEIGTRGITSIRDVLAIASNSCGYSQRLDPGELEHTGQSLSLALLTLYLLNGEILCPRAASMSSVCSNIFDFLKDTTMSVCPPLGSEERGSTFTKHCRFPDVTLSREGIETRGIIWRLGKTIDREDLGWYPVPEWPRDPSKNYLGDHEHRDLWRIYGYVDGYGHTELAEYLADFLRNIAPCGYNEDWSWKHFMYMMARSVARAINNGGRLRLGSIWRGGGYSAYSAIFIEGAHTQGGSWGDSFAFTSWACAEEQRQADDGIFSCAPRYVSLKIGKPEFYEPPKIRPEYWLNGLCFFERSDAENPVVVAWPRCLL
jgi:hypothetical protein